MPFSYPHMCCSDHVEIGHRDSEHERCPLCRALDELEKAYSALEAQGVPRERARSVPNGISVLMTRMDRQVSDLQAELQTARQWIGAFRSTPAWADAHPESDGVCPGCDVETAEVVPDGYFPHARGCLFAEDRASADAPEEESENG